MNGRVDRISLATARPFVEQWHYAGCIPTGRNIFFGWYVPGTDYGLPTDLVGDTLYAVAGYGPGVNCHAADYLSRTTGYAIPREELIELTRLCRIEPKVEQLPLTAFLAACHRALKHDGIRFVVTFSDPMHGHNGGIYRAANFVYLGKTNPELHVIDANGNIVHRRRAYRYARQNGIGLIQARAILGLRPVKTECKDRWFLPLVRPGTRGRG